MNVHYLLYLVLWQAELIDSLVNQSTDKSLEETRRDLEDCGREIRITISQDTLVG